MVGERIQRVKNAIPKFTERRAQILRETLSEIEKGIRTSPTILLEMDIPPSLSEEFEMNRRKKIKGNRRELLMESFPRFREFSEKRVF